MQQAARGEGQHGGASGAAGRMRTTGVLSELGLEHKVGDGAS